MKRAKKRGTITMRIQQSFERLVVAAAVVGMGAGASCDCGPAKTPTDDGGAEPVSESAEDDTAGDGTAAATSGSSGPSSGGGEPPAVDWAMDAFHLATETHGETTQFRVEKIELFPDGTTKQTTILCGLEDRVFEGRWRSTSGGVLIEPAPGEDVLIFAQSHYSKLMLTESERCEEVRIEGFSPGGVETGGDTLTRGDLCLNCAAVDYDQLQCCGSMQPISFCDLSACE